MYLLWVVLVFLALCIVRVIKGPSIWDRLLGMNLVYTKVLIIIILLASYTDAAYLLDFAIVCVLLTFISTFFTVRFLLGKTASKRGGK